MYDYEPLPDWILADPGIVKAIASSSDVPDEAIEEIVRIVSFGEYGLDDSSEITIALACNQNNSDELEKLIEEYSKSWDWQICESIAEGKNTRDSILLLMVEKRITRWEAAKRRLWIQSLKEGDRVKDFSHCVL